MPRRILATALVAFLAATCAQAALTIKATGNTTVEVADAHIKVTSSGVVISREGHDDVIIVTATDGRPTPPPVKTLADKVKDAAATVTSDDHSTEAEAIASVYRTVSKKLDDGELKTRDEATAAVNNAMGKLDPAMLGRWEPLRVVIKAWLNPKLTQGPEAIRPKEMADLLRQIADALEAV